MKWSRSPSASPRSQAQEPDEVEPELKRKSKKHKAPDSVEEDGAGSARASGSDPKAEKKAQLSRKSAAYHKAVRRAKNRGLTEDAAKRLGKQAPCTHMSCVRVFASWEAYAKTS